MITEYEARVEGMARCIEAHYGIAEYTWSMAVAAATSLRQNMNYDDHTIQAGVDRATKRYNPDGDPVRVTVEAIIKLLANLDKEDRNKVTQIVIDAAISEMGVQIAWEGRVADQNTKNLVARLGAAQDGVLF